jgi:hypothetical protein
LFIFLKLGKAVQKSNELPFFSQIVYHRKKIINMKHSYWWAIFGKIKNISVSIKKVRMSQKSITLTIGCFSWKFLLETSENYLTFNEFILGQTIVSTLSCCPTFQWLPHKGLMMQSLKFQTPPQSHGWSPKQTSLYNVTAKASNHGTSCYSIQFTACTPCSASKNLIKIGGRCT